MSSGLKDVLPPPRLSFGRPALSPAPLSCSSVRGWAWCRERGSHRSGRAAPCPTANMSGAKRWGDRCEGSWRSGTCVSSLAAGWTGLSQGRLHAGRQWAGQRPGDRMFQTASTETGMQEVALRSEAHGGGGGGWSHSGDQMVQMWMWTTETSSTVQEGPT